MGDSIEKERLSKGFIPLGFAQSHQLRPPQSRVDGFFSLQTPT
ncbi:hypothetical protein D1AOALGA4SA_3870 [Olavius algarvensis Delta 1 endosymbiont]|nr:hypothetical protein D1AOALGA4SA_3870 [Olavius algarvensis Delta 1 endosymbiont]